MHSDHWDLHARGIIVARTEYRPNPHIIQRTWYPVSIRWWKRKGGSWRDIGIHIRRSYEDRGKPRKLSRQNQARLDAAQQAFQAANALANKGSLDPTLRAQAAKERAQAAHEIARIMRKTFPGR